MEIVSSHLVLLLLRQCRISRSAQKCLEVRLWCCFLLQKVKCKLKWRQIAKAAIEAIVIAAAAVAAAAAGTKLTNLEHAKIKLMDIFKNSSIRQQKRTVENDFSSI